MKIRQGCFIGALCGMSPDSLADWHLEGLRIW